MKGFVEEKDILNTNEDGKSFRIYEIKDMGKFPSVTSVLHEAWPMGYGLINFFQTHSKEDCEKIRAIATKNGTEIHDLINRFNHKEVLSSEETDRISGYINWFKDMRPKILESEKVVVFDEDGIQTAGRLDMIVKIGPDKYVIDLKTGGGIYDNYGPQIGLYSKASDCKKCGILLVLDKGKKRYRFKEFNVDKGYEAFKCAYGIYKYLKDKDK